MKLAAFIWTIAAIVAVVGALTIEAGSFTGILFFLPFCVGPLAVTLLIIGFCGTKMSSAILLVSSALYFGWFLFVYMSAFHWHIDPQSAIAMVFVGIYALPVLFIFWVAALLTRKDSQADQDTVGNEGHHGAD